jgi:hypothetical protein
MWRDTKNMFEDTCFDQSDCTVYWMTNAPNGDRNALRSKYSGVITRFETRPFDWLSGLVSYTYSKSQGSVEYTQNAGADFDVFPDHFVNRYGYLSDDARHRVKASGFVRAPFGTTFGLNFEWDSGTPYSVTASNPPAGYGALFIEPRGSRRLPNYRQLDLQVQHDLNFGRVRAGLIAAVYNVLGSEIATSVGGSIGDYTECDAVNGTDCLANPLFGKVADAAPGLAVVSNTFGKSTTFQRPRQYEVGVRFEF